MLLIYLQVSRVSRGIDINQILTGKHFCHNFKLIHVICSYAIFSQQHILAQETATVTESLGICWIEVNCSGDISHGPIVLLKFAIGLSSIAVCISVAVVNIQQLIKVLYCRLPVPDCS